VLFVIVVIVIVVYVCRARKKKKALAKETDVATPDDKKAMDSAFQLHLEMQQRMKQNNIVRGTSDDVDEGDIARDGVSPTDILAALPETSDNAAALPQDTLMKHIEDQV